MFTFYVQRLRQKSAKLIASKIVKIGATEWLDIETTDEGEGDRKSEGCDTNVRTQNTMALVFSPCPCNSYNNANSLHWK